MPASLNFFGKKSLKLYVEIQKKLIVFLYDWKKDRQQLTSKFILSTYRTCCHFRSVMTKILSVLCRCSISVFAPAFAKVWKCLFGRRDPKIIKHFQTTIAWLQVFSAIIWSLVSIGIIVVLVEQIACDLSRWQIVLTFPIYTRSKLLYVQRLLFPELDSNLKTARNVH